MQYSFDVQEAVDYGIDEAIIIWNLRFWIIKNKANNKHFHDGSTWTYNSHEALQRLFPFWSKDQIRRIIAKLLKKEIIIKGNFNQNTHNQTLWYAFKDEDKLLSSKLVFSHIAESPHGDGENNKSIWRNSKIEMAESSNVYKETDIKPDIKPDISLPKKRKGFEFPKLEEVEKYCIEKNINTDFDKFHNYYFIAGEGKDSKGNVVKNWKLKLLSWAENSKNYKALAKQNNAENKEITNLRADLKRAINNQLHYDIWLAGNAIEKRGNVFLMEVDAKTEKELKKRYMGILEKFKITLKIL